MNGSEEEYQQVGFIFQESSGTRLPLFGRPEYSGALNWEYYVKTNQDNSNIKIPLDNTKELYNDDIVNVNSYSGDFMVEIYKLDTIRYLPTTI